VVDVASGKLFPGQYFDQETQLHYNYFRDYDASLGRYVQSDPIGLLDSVNTYVYVKNSPVNLKDEVGLSSCGSNCSAKCEGNYASCAKKVFRSNSACEKSSFKSCVKIGGSRTTCKRAVEITCAVAHIPLATACEIKKIACNLSCFSKTCICEF